ncbi:MAG: N-acetyl-1-D-myo-inositol-2-amino-2-deoxy-alpha-D-glucopyranoside deacetylase [Dermatophilaceae bacterium]
MSEGNRDGDLLADLVIGSRARLVFVHAHPDDESLTTGVAIAHLVARGHDVHVLTCTLGEEGEVIPPTLAHLEGDGPALARHRLGELTAAVATLGATGHLLTDPAGEPGGFRDSGMAGSTAATHRRAWSGIPLDRATAAVRAVIADLHPDVVLTYDASGGYGHPDHVRTHDATRAALAAMGSDAPALLVVLTPRSWADADRAWLAAHLPDHAGWQVPAADEPHLPSVVADAAVTRRVVDAEAATVQRAALRAHASQVVVGDGWFALSNSVASRLAGREGYARIDPATGRSMDRERTL